MRFLAASLLCLAAFGGPALGQEIPGRVGRLAWFDGGVALYQDPDRGWEDAAVNFPITSENSLWTDPGARAEVQVGPIALRMDEATQLDVSRLDDTVLDATLARGRLAVRIHRLRPADLVRLSTPQATFRLSARGRYRLDADPDGGQSRLSVFSGLARMETASGSIPIGAGESVVVWGEEAPAYAFEDAYLTDFDRWAEARDERWIVRRAPEYVSYEMTGYEDLDAWGVWSEDPVYGAVWFPTRVAQDWAPYRFGRWVYVRPWGWTWVDAEPWGYAPFHYGRWVYLRERWGWCPGRRTERPVWAPALVGFIGGAGWSVSATRGDPLVGWYPLAPSEPYRPWYPASRTYVNNINITVVNVPRQLAREHREWNRDRAATVVRREALVEERPVQQARVPVAVQALRAAPVIAAPAAALPTHDEVREIRQQAARQAPPRFASPSPNPEPSARTAQPAAAQNALARPNFARPQAAPKPAPADVAPPPMKAPGTPPQTAPFLPPRPQAGPPSGPASPPRVGERPSHEAQQQRTAQEAQQRAGEAQRRAALEAQQQRAAEEARQRAAEAQRRAIQEAQRQRAVQEAQQQRAAQQAQQQRAAQQAQQQAAEAQRRAAQQAQQQRAAEEARQRAVEAQRRAIQEAQRQRAVQEAQQQRAAQQAQQRAAEAQRRAAQEAQRQRAAQEARQRAAEAQRRAVQPPQPRTQPESPPERGGGKEKTKAQDLRGEGEPRAQ